MALFKVLRGGKSRIGTNVTSIHDGYAYFTDDEGGFYIDTATARTKINTGTEILFGASDSAPIPQREDNALWFVTET